MPVSHTQRFEGVVTELRGQGLTVKVVSASNETWYVKGDGIYLGYIATGTELLALKAANRLNLPGIKALG